MKTIILQRQGTGATIRSNHQPLLTPGCGNEYPGFYVSLENCRHYHKQPAAEDGYRYEISLSSGKPWPNDRDRHTGIFGNVTFAKACAMLGAEITRITGQPHQVSETVEAYCWSMHNEGEVFFLRCAYKPGTIHTMPGIWSVEDAAKPFPIITWAKDVTTIGHRNFNEPASIPAICRWDVVAAAAMQHLPTQIEMNRRHWPEHEAIHKARHWLAWLISEYRKYGIDGERGQTPQEIAKELATH